MSGYRFDDDREAQYGEAQQQITGIISSASVEGDDSNLAVRVNLDEVDGDVHQVVLEQFLSPGLIARPDPAIETEAIIANVGADPTAAVIVGIQDSAQLAILQKEAVALRETILYASDALAENTKRIKITTDEIRAGNLNGNEKELANLAALESENSARVSLQTSFNTMLTHYLAFYALTIAMFPLLTVPGPLPTPNVATATIDGTSVFKAE